MAMVLFPIRDDAAEEKTRNFSFRPQQARQSRGSAPRSPSARASAVAVFDADLQIQSPDYMNSSLLPLILRRQPRLGRTRSSDDHPRKAGVGIPPRNNRPCDCEPPL